MSDYCVCTDCGCKHLVWEKLCPYCKRIKELETENANLKLDIKELREMLEDEGVEL